MNLDDLKQSWEALGVQAHQHDSLQRQQIHTQLKRRYASTLRRLLWPEWLALMFCWYFAATFVYQFFMFDRLFLQAVASITVVVLAVFPALRMWLLYQLFAIRLDQPFVEVQHSFRLRKRSFQRIQLLNGGLGLLLVISVMVLSTKIYNEFEVVSGKNFWSIVYFLTFGLVMWMEFRLKRRYGRILSQAEHIIQKLTS
ncbi:MAG: hypothetical protein AAGI38_04600 [Bacteroidota bacterium]